MAELYQSKDVDDCIAKVVPPYNRDDFKQDLFVILMAKDEATITRLYESNELKMYCTGIIARQVYQSRSAYNTQYCKKNHVEINDRIEVKDEQYQEPPIVTPEMLEQVDKHYNPQAVYPFFTKLVEAVANVSSMRELSRNTGIPTSTISKQMKKVREFIKTKAND